MQLKEHILYGGAVSVGLSPFFGWKSLLFFLASILIDIDHYLDFLYYAKFKSWGIHKMFAFHNQLAQWRYKPNFFALEAFHTAEFLLTLLFLAFYFSSTELFLIFYGMIFHLALDLVRLRQWGNIHLRAFSFLGYWIYVRRMRRSGINPEGLFDEVYRKVSDNGSPASRKNTVS